MKISINYMKNRYQLYENRYELCEKIDMNYMKNRYQLCENYIEFLLMSDNYLNDSDFCWLFSRYLVS